MNLNTLTPLYKPIPDAISRALDGTCYVVRGCAPTANGTGLRVDVATGDHVEAGTQRTYAGGNVTLSAASAAVTLLYRRDIVYLDSTGTLTIGVGTPALLTTTTPVAPALPASATLVAICFVAPGQTVLTAIDVEDCRQVRVNDMQAFNIKVFGATGDGTTDDTTALTNAIIAANAAGGGTVFVPPTANSYIVTSVPMLSNVTLAGAGPASLLKLKSGQASSTRMVKATTKSNIVIRDLGFDGNQANQAADSATQQSHCIFIENTCVNVRVLNCDIKNASGDAIFVYGATSAQANTFTLIQGNHITATRRQGISLGGLRYCRVIGNEVLDGLTGGSNQGGGIHIEADDDGMPSTDIVIAGNTVKAAYKGGITCGGNPTGGTQANFRSIDIVGNTVEATADTSNGSGIEVNGYVNFSITGNTVRGSALIGIYCRSAEGTISGNTVSDSNHEGIYLTSVGGSTTLARVTVSGNTVIRSNVTQIGPFGTITADSIIDSIISTNTVYGVGGNNHGIWVAGASARTSVTGNNVQHSAASTGTGIIESGTSNTNSICANITNNFTTAISKVGSATIVRDNIPDTTLDQVWSHRLVAPIGLYAANITTETAFATNTSYWVYIGKAPAAITTCDVTTNVTTAAVAAITWAEVAIAKGTPAANGSPALSRLGFTSVAATFNATGIKKTSVTLSGVAAGDDLWVGFGSQCAVTMFQVRGLLADDIQSGVFQTSTRPSTMAVPTTASIAGATIVPPWCQVKL